MSRAPSAPPSGSRWYQKLYRAIGFQKGYNAILFTIFVGALFGFAQARLEFLSFNGIYCNPLVKPGTGAAPGECFWYRSYRRNNVGIILHLATVLPAAILACFQFIPVIRHKATIYHRVAGHIIILLVLLSQAGVLMIANHAFGGDNSSRMFVGTLVIATTTALGLAYYNIKCLQIDQHRAWMIRAWAWLASIITLRLILIIASRVQAAWGGEALTYVSFPCDELLFLFQNNNATLYQAYPACRPENLAAFTSFGHIAVQANAAIKAAPNQAAALDTFFAPAGWLAWTLHVLAVELYLNLTPAETERLRHISYERQLKAGLKNPGFAGTTAGRLGDAVPRDFSAEMKAPASPDSLSDKSREDV